MSGGQGEIILHRETSPLVLATYVLQAVCAEWPPAQADADRTLREYHAEFGSRIDPLLQALTTKWRTEALDHGLPRDYQEWWAAVDPFASPVAQAIRARFVTRWLLNSETGDGVFAVSLLVDMLKPYTKDPTFIRRGGWVAVRRNVAWVLQGETGVAAKTWRKALDAKRDARQALRQYNDSFFGRHQRALVRLARFWALKNICQPGAEYPLTLEQVCRGVDEDLPEGSRHVGALDQAHLSRDLAPFDEAMGRSRARGAPLGFPRSR